MPDPSSAWRCRDRVLHLDPHPAVMGVVNVTPDSFSDGGRFLDPVAAVERGLEMEAEGAAILDVGGESSRPGAEAVSIDEELRRVLPVIDGLARQASCLVSIDTTKAEVARRALEAGAHIVNDISAGLQDPAMAGVVRDAGAGFVAMHMQGTPRTMQAAPAYGDVVAEVRAFLAGRVAALEAEGIPRDRVVVDPGIGFGKTLAHNLDLLRGLPALVADGRPVLIGVSRKSFLGAVTGRPVTDRLAPSLGALAFALMRGARIARVHDVKESCSVARLIATLADSAGRNRCSSTA